MFSCRGSSACRITANMSSLSAGPWSWPSRPASGSTTARFAFPPFTSRNGNCSLRGYIQVAAAAVGLSSILAAVLMVLLASRFGNGIPFAALVWGALTILPFALLGVGSALLRTTRRIFAAQFYDQLLRPVVLILLVGAAAVAGLALHAATALMFTAVAAAIALAALLIHLLRSPGALTTDNRRLFALARVVFAQHPLADHGRDAGTAQSTGDHPAWIAGRTARSRTVFAAWRLASLAPFALVSLSVVSGPLVASAYHRRDRAELHRITSLSARIGLAFAAVASGVLLLVGRPLLALFGPEFPQAYPALAILLAGAMVNAFTGIVGYLLTLTGRQTQALLIFAGGLIVSIALNLVLIPPFGIIGAAIASATALSCWNLAMLVYVRRAIGIDTSAIGLRPVGSNEG